MTIIADDHNHTDAGMLVAGNGNLLAFETLDGPDLGPGSPPGRVRVFRSVNGGSNWTGPLDITALTGDTAGQHWFPRAVQKIDGVIHLMFRDNAHFNSTQIGQIWSGDYGYTWSGHSVFALDTAHPREFSFIGSQGGYNETVLAAIGGQINHWQSWDNGNTWEGPYITSTFSGAHDGEFTMGCRGVIFYFWTSPSGCAT